MAYTNSPMVVYTKLSPNHSGQRTQPISIITPHCIVGYATAEGLGDWFAKSSTQASSNYGVDKDGRIGMYVEEKNRSWCSSSSVNDQRAITIECASDTKEPYSFPDITYQNLIELCIDICKRNGKSKLLWFGDKDKTMNYSPKSDEMLLTVHRWFANKSCPGNWMYARMGELAEKVTAALDGSTSSDTSTDTTPAASQGEVENEKTVWDFLYGKIGNAYGVAGLMGNLYAESGLRPDNLQNTYEKKLNITDEEYTKLVDDGNYPDFTKDKAGYGLAQWTYWSRKQSLLDFAKSQGKSIGNLDMQLAFLWKELSEGYKTTLAVLKAATNVRDAAVAVLTQYERPADQSEAVQTKRTAFGQTYYDRYAKKQETVKWYRVRKTWTDSKTQKGAYKILDNAKKCANQNPGYSVFDSDGVKIYEPKSSAANTASAPSPDVPFLVKVSIPDLNIRSGPGTQYGRRGYIPKGVYTIIETNNDGTWGKLKSGAGWICLKYTTRL